jgi:hypothetical protein
VDGLPTSIFMRMGPFGMKARVSQVKQRGRGRVGIGKRMAMPIEKGV